MVIFEEYDTIAENPRGLDKRVNVHKLDSRLKSHIVFRLSVKRVRVFVFRNGTV